jgi:hypothetical protein
MAIKVKVMKEESKIFILIQKNSDESLASKGRQLKLMMLATEISQIKGQFHLIDGSDLNLYHSISQVLSSWNISNNQNLIVSPAQKELIAKCYKEFPVLNWTNLDQIMEKSPQAFDDKIKIPLMLLKCIYFPRTLCYIPNADLSFDWINQHISFLNEICLELHTNFFLYSMDGLKWHNLLSKPLIDVKNINDSSHHLPFIIKNLLIKDLHQYRKDDSSKKLIGGNSPFSNHEIKGHLKIKKVS